MNDEEKAAGTTNSNGEVKKPLTEEERLELATKLDKGLDDFINSLPQREPTEGIPIERWEEEILNHPFFMKKTPEPGDKLHPLYEGLQQLKYDPDVNSPKELASSYKEDGNNNYKYKNFRSAIIAYTEGIKVKCGDPEIEATLLNNRSTVNFHIKNYRSSLLDAELALKINPDYVKAQLRAAKCCFFINQYDKCIEYCDMILEKNKDDQEVKKLRQDSVKAKQAYEKEVRAKEARERREARAERDLLAEIIKRQINVNTGGKPLSMKHLKVALPQLSQVRLDEGKNLIWSVILSYPEYKTMDFIQEFSECDIFLDQIIPVFESRPEWDIEGKYSINNLNVYYENKLTNKIYTVNMYLTLKEIMQEKTFLLDSTPAFIIFAKNSQAEKDFLLKH